MEKATLVAKEVAAAASKGSGPQKPKVTIFLQRTGIPFLVGDGRPQNRIWKDPWRDESVANEVPRAGWNECLLAYNLKRVMRILGIEEMLRGARKITPSQATRLSQPSQIYPRVRSIPVE